MLPKEEVAGRILDWVVAHRRAPRPRCVACADATAQAADGPSAFSSAATAAGTWPRRLRVAQLAAQRGRACQRLAARRIGMLAGAAATVQPAGPGSPRRRAR